jgi:hypothetical protein
MKTTLLVIALALFSACGKKNDVAILKEEATTIARYYQPKLDDLDQRVQAIFKRGSTIPGNLPGIKEVGERLQQARDTLVQMRGIVAPGPDGKSAVEKMAEDAAKQNNAANLRKLIHDTESTLVAGVTTINDNLTSVESWIAYYDRQALAMPIAKPEQVPATPEAPAAPPAAQAPAPVAPAPQPKP